MTNEELAARWKAFQAEVLAHPEKNFMLDLDAIPPAARNHLTTHQYGEASDCRWCEQERGTTVDAVNVRT